MRISYFSYLLRYVAITVLVFLSPISFAGKETQEQLPLSELRAFTEAYYQIKSSYVNPVEDAELIRAAIRGMVGSLDSHSRFLGPREFERFNTDNIGEYAGIGLQFNDHKFGIEVAQVIKNSPASRAGIRPGMIVTHIDNTQIKYLTADDALAKLKGEVDSEVALTVASAEFAKPKEFRLTREIILLESVTSVALPNKTGYVAISQFTLNSVEEFKQAIFDLSTDGNLERLILDLRDNPGGVMEIAVELSDLFIQEGKLLISTGRTDDSNQTFYAHKMAPFSDMEVVVVINGGSASASEILVAALKDHQKATVLGETTYGKGTIQTVIPLNRQSGIKLTTAEYFSPAGSKIQDEGITPDVNFVKKALNNPYNVSILDDPQLLQAYNLLTSQ